MYLFKPNRRIRPIEEYVMKTNENILSGYDLETNILCGFTAVTSEDCVNWIDHSGY